MRIKSFLLLVSSLLSTQLYAAADLEQSLEQIATYQTIDSKRALFDSNLAATAAAVEGASIAGGALVLGAVWFFAPTTGKVLKVTLATGEQAARLSMGPVGSGLLLGAAGAFVTGLGLATAEGVFWLVDRLRGVPIHTPQKLVAGTRTASGRRFILEAASREPELARLTRQLAAAGR